MAAIGDAAAADLIARAAEVGITADEITTTLRMSRGSNLAVMSHSDHDRIERMIDAKVERARLLDRVAHLATCMGHDADAKRRAADEKFRQEHALRGFIAQCEAWCRKNGVDIRTEDEKRAAAQAKATPRQVDYIVKLLAQRGGDTAGFIEVAGLVRADGGIDSDAVRALPRSVASKLIDSLTGRY